MAETADLVTVEFYGIPRQRAGRAELAVAARTVADLLDAIERTCPGLTGLRRPDGRLSAHYLLSLEGREFLTDLSRELRPGERVLLLSADAGG
jgi:molybdopterin converting factor small subunit